MPQMYPLNWIMLFIYFILIFILFNILNYYIYMYKSNNLNNKLLFKNINLTWKW
uniref:ATP synthase F0 subunit 8 n=1 Tax=Ahamus yushuensis TaxID=92035 RepID=UPI001EDDD24C|nr:ATP synthase F0 subunit 8 [Ahamus yushuensis]UIX24742.1 ATP synthase F0 subunit 8 [Ahamus yushuensis]UJP71234.1 ATP synthase F0 subunit 8 [Thitarodes sp. XS20]WRY71462.1 ATP synthase F0 subunit 8 [Ahamus luquensis]